MRDRAEIASPEKTSDRLRVVFVGAFAAASGNSPQGGVITASRGLLHSPISRSVEWIPVDTTSGAVPPPPLRVRMLRAAARAVRFAWILATDRVDLAFVMTSDGSSFVEKGAMALFARAMGVPVVLAPRSGFIADDLRHSRFFRWYVPLVLRSCSRVMCQGASWAEFYGPLAGGRERIVTIPNWIEIDTLPRSQVAATAHRGVRVLYMGWVERFKGIFDLIDAAAMAGAKLADVTFVVCGKGGDFEAARARVAAQGLADRFEFRGWVSGAEKARIFQDADVYVHPSHREGMPNALIEAMGAGLACIGARTGGVPDLLRSDALGLLFDPGDVAGLSAALVELCSDPARRAALGATARSHVIAEHSAEATWPRVLQMFRAAIADRRTASSTP